MKVLIVSEDIPNPHLGGLGKHALNLAHALAARGHEVDVLGSAKHPVQNHPEQQGPGRFYADLVGYERGWKQQALGVFHAFAVKANARPVREAILRHAPRYDVVHYHGHLPWLAAGLPDALPFVQTRHDQGGDCMLRTRYIESGSREGVCGSTDPRDCAKCAVAEPAWWQRELSAQAVRFMRKQTMKSFQRHPVVFVSQFLFENFQRTQIGRVSARVVPNAVDARQLNEVAQLADSPNEEAVLRLFSAGALFAYKGFGQMLSTLLKVSARTQREFRLRLAGAGPLERELSEQFSGECIEMLGWRSYADVVAETLTADAVIVPSLCEEPCATSVLEALALGRTVYAMATGGTPEMLAYAGSAGGELKLFQNLDDLAAAALQHPPEGKRGPSRPLDFENSVERMAERIESVYLDIVAAKGGRRNVHA